MRSVDLPKAIAARTCLKEAQSPALVPARSLTGEAVVAVLEQLAGTRGLPRTISVDHGTEFTSRALDAWAEQRGITLDSIRPGKPNDNAFIESFNSRLRDECLNEHWFQTWPKPKC
jgi:putative transposase